MASESESSPAADDTVLVDPPVSSDEQSPSGDQWPVADLYYVEPDNDAPALDGRDADEETVVVAGGAAPVRRRFPPDFEPGPALVLLAVLAVVGALVLGAFLLGSGDEEPASRQTPTSPSATTSTVETSPPPAASAGVAVRDVVGLGLAEARSTLEAQGLRVRVRRSESDRPAGEVLEQAPPAQAEVAQGTVVALIVARAAAPPPGATQVEVPSVIGLAASSAVSALRDAGFEARVRLVTSSERSGTIVAQTPAGGTEVREGATVRLEIARAPTVQRVEVPDVVGSAAAAARRQLRSAGLRVTTTSVVSQEPAGTVIAQSPRGGAELREGGTVKLTVSTGPAEVEVPDVTGQDEASATSELERAGFQVRVIDESIEDPAQDGVVLLQAPAGGSTARDGATVTLTIGRLD
jgi:beta-lactam-binding protein with PASTA domain